METVWKFCKQQKIPFALNDFFQIQSLFSAEIKKTMSIAIGVSNNKQNSFKVTSQATSTVRSLMSKAAHISPQ